MRRARGFTLIELMLTTAIAGIIIGIVASSLYSLQVVLRQHMSYAETQQNGRTALAFLKRYARMAGWGMSADASATGGVAIGACYNDTDSRKQRLDCDHIDADANNSTTYPGGTDRLRVMYVQPENGGGVFELGYATTAATVANAIPVVDLNNSAPPNHPFAANTYALVSGPCVGGGHGVDLITITASFSPTAAFRHEYTYTAIESGTSVLACASGYASGFGVGKAVVADFYIDRTTDTSHPSLRVRLNPNDAVTAGYVVANDIDDLQVRFYIDTGEGNSTAPDRVWDEVCDNPDDAPQAPSNEGGCTDAFTNRERLARVLAVELALVARTRDYDEIHDATALTVQNHTYTGPAGYRRWIYRSTVAIRNNDL